MLRFYLLPIEVVITGEGTSARGPKYFHWFHDPDPPALVSSPKAMMDYGLIDAALVVAKDITPEDHAALVANPDVVSPPEDIDQNISAGALPTVQAALEALRIPADWVDTSYTYRQMLRMIAGLFQFAQRYHVMHNEQLIDNQSQLDLRWNQIPLARRQRIIATADELGYDYSEVQNTWRVRRILMHLGNQWGSQPAYIGGTEL